MGYFPLLQFTLYSYPVFRFSFPVDNQTDVILNPMSGTFADAPDAPSTESAS